MNLTTMTLGMIHRPGEAMRSAVQRPRLWWLPAVLLILSMAVLMAASQSYAIQRANEQQTQMLERVTASMSADQAKVVRESAKPLSATTYWLSGLGVGLVTVGAGWVLRGTIAHFSSMAAGGTSVWGPTFAVGIWSMLPFFVRDLLQALYVVINRQLVSHQGLSFLVATGDILKDSRSIVYALLGNIDPFTVWHIVLLGIGISVATKLSKGKAVTMAVLIWAAFVVLKLIPVLLGSAVLGRMGG